MFDCLAPSHVATQQRRHCCRARAGAQPVQAPAPLSAQEHDGALQSRGEAGGLHSNRALGGTEMDLHGNNKAVKEKEKEPHPEIKWVCETGELTRERVLGGKMRMAGRGWKESLGVCCLQQGSALMSTSRALPFRASLSEQSLHQIIEIGKDH